MTSGSGGSDREPVDQYVQLLSSSPPPNANTARAILNQALTNPRVFTGFSELGSIPSVVEALGKTQGGDSFLRTLDLFAFGTYGEYTKAEGAGTYLTLTEAQLNKLRQLTVVSLVQRTAAEASAAVAAKNDVSQKSSRRRGRKPKPAAASGGGAVPYSSIRSELSLPPDSPLRDLEDLLISCVYAGLLVGRLDQRSMSLLVGPGSAHQPPCAARDVRVDGDDVTRMIAALESFHKRGEEVAAALGDAADGARDGRAEDAKRWAAVEERVREIKSKIKDRQATGAAVGGGPEGGPPGDAWGATVAMDAMGGDAGMAMDTAMEGSASAGGARRQTKRSRGGAYGAEPFGRY